MRDALGIDRGTDILDYIESLRPDEKHKAEEAVRDVEREAMVG